MLLIINTLILLVNAVTFRREFTTILLRVALFILLYYQRALRLGPEVIGIYQSIFHSTAITHSFDLFIYIIAPIILFFSPESFVNSTDLASILLSGIPACAVTPAVVYPNAETQKLDILQENKNQSGIYRWVNKASGKSYVGSSILLHTRLSQYFSLAHLKRYGYMSINRALIKYGYSGFKLEILEYCEPSNCIEREQYYLDLLAPEYNISLIAGAPMTGRKHSEETKARMSEANQGNKVCLGRKLSEETRAKMSTAKVGKKFSEETRAKIALSLKGEKNPRFGKAKPEGAGRIPLKIEVLDLLTNEKQIYDSMGAAALDLGIKKSIISLYFSRNQKSAHKGRYIFSLV